MSTLTIRKKSLKTWLHTDSILGNFIISKFYFNADNVSFQIVEQGQSKRVIYNITDITLYAVATGGSPETFSTITELSLRLEELNYPAFQYDGQITSIANLIDAGTGITITGDGTEASPYVIASGGAGSQTLAETLVLGNITDGNDIGISEGDAVLLDNGSKLVKGTTDAGNGGNKGIALKCSVDYELKWEAGRLYVMEQDGFTIREVSYNFTNTPTTADDDTKGFVIGSRWVLDNGDIYVCTDDTTASAVWELQGSGTVPTIQEVLDEGRHFTDVFNVDDNVYAAEGYFFRDDVPASGHLSSSQISLNAVDNNISWFSVINQAFSAVQMQANFLDGDTLMYTSRLSAAAFNEIGENISPFASVEKSGYIGSGSISVELDYPDETNILRYRFRNRNTSNTYDLATEALIKTAAFTAENDQPYTTNGTITVTDPTSVTNKGYIVHVIGGTTTIGGVGYTTGALVYRYYNGSSWVSKDYGAGGGATNLGYTPSPTNGIVTSDTGTDATIPLADGTNAGLLTPAEKTIIGNTSGTNTGDNSPNTNANAYADAKVTDAIVNGVTTVAPSQNAVFDALALKANLERVEQFIFSKANATLGSHTGTTAETVLFSSDITAGEFVAGDFMRLMYDFTKSGILGTATFRFRAGTTGTTADALISTLTGSASILDYGFNRERFQFLSGNILSGILNNYTANSTDIVNVTAAKTQTSLNPANAWKLTVTVQLSNSGDTASCVGYRISKIKSF